jgi:ATP-dependent HslUV protease subunit HslV
MAIGSGGPYALAAARALIRFSDLTATEVAQEALKIASEICIYTNANITVEELDMNQDTDDRVDKKMKG